MSASLKLALVGYGKMGRLLDQMAPAHGFEVALRLGGAGNSGGQGITKGALNGIDAAIEFSTPEAAASNLSRLAELNIPSVAGTTGWLRHLPEVQAAVQAADSGLIWSPNFSIGIAVFRRLVASAADLMSRQDSYGAWAWEIHHDAKKDAPSGTLLHLVQAMKEHGYRLPIDVGSNRAGRHPGTHEIGFDSQFDTITLRHAARGREGFAEGALQAARWIIGRKGVYTFEDMLFGFESQNSRPRSQNDREWRH